MGLRAKYETAADPDGVLPPDERARRADLLHRAHMLRAAHASVKARRARGARSGRQAGEHQPPNPSTRS
jgi:hypothetical protein